MRGRNCDAANRQCRSAASWRPRAEWLGERMTQLGAVICRGDRPSIMAATNCCAGWRILLVPVLRRRDGHGLAFVRHHHQRHRRAEARAASRCRANSASMSAAAAARIRARRRTNSSPSASASASTARRWRNQPARRQGRQRRRAGRLRPLSARLHRRRRRALGRRPAGHERRQPRGAPLSLAFGRAEELRRPAACGDRRRKRRARSSTSPTAAPRRRAPASSTCSADARAGPHRRANSRHWMGERRRTPAQPMLPHLVMPAHHDVREERRRHAPPARQSRRGRRARPVGLSPSCCWCRASARARCKALAMVAEVVHGAPCRFTDPGALLARPWRQGPASVPGAAEGL